MHTPKEIADILLRRPERITANVPPPPPEEKGRIGKILSALGSLVPIFQTKAAPENDALTDIKRELAHLGFVDIQIDCFVDALIESFRRTRDELADLGPEESRFDRLGEYVLQALTALSHDRQVGCIAFIPFVKPVREPLGTTLQPAT